jgi:cytoskeletal protein CcmA (bactofilin family)
VKRRKEVKRLKKKILSISLILLSLTLIPKTDVQAATTPNLGEDVTVAEDEVIQGPYIKTGDNITISGTIEGDAYIAGSMVSVDGTIKGDLMTAGGAVTIKGEVEQDIRAAGGMVTIDGRVGKNVTALGGTVTLGSDADVDGNVVALGGTLAHLGNIDGGVLAYGERATLAGRIGGDIKARTQTVSVTKTAVLDGDLDYSADQEASVSAQARIVGTVRRTPVAKTLTQAIPKAGRGVLFRFRLLSYLSMLLLGLVLLRLAPRQTTAVSQLIGEQPWRGLGLGLLGLVLIPVAAVALMLTVIGVPLAALIGVGYILVLTSSSLFSGLFLGQKIFDLANLKENRYAMMAVGLLVLQLTMALPTVGGLVRFLSILASTGAVVTLGREVLRRLE